MEPPQATAVMVNPANRIPPVAPDPQLLRALGRLVRGLSILFWGLPVALVVCVQATQTELLQHIGLIPPAITNLVPPAVVTGWLMFGLWHLGGFQPQERIWVRALDRAKLLAMANFGLSPFLYWSNRMPEQLFFSTTVQVLAVTGLLFLDSLNVVLHRLSAMLPDENLRVEARQFTSLNRWLVLLIVLFGVGLFTLKQHPEYLPALGNYLAELQPAGMWVMLFLVLLPLAITMALIWKTKSVILDSVFGA